MWLSPFWPPESAQADHAFNISLFTTFLDSHGTGFRPTPPRRLSKIVLESKHAITSSISIRLCTHTPGLPIEISLKRAIRISNHLYGSAVLSTYELANGFTRPFIGSPQKLPPDIMAVRETLWSKRRLTCMLRSKNCEDLYLQAGDQVELYVKRDHDKRGKWSLPRTVLSIGKAS